MEEFVLSAERATKIEDSNSELNSLIGSLENQSVEDRRNVIACLFDSYDGIESCTGKSIIMKGLRQVLVLGNLKSKFSSEIGQKYEADDYLSFFLFFTSVTNQINDEELIFEFCEAVAELLEQTARLIYSQSDRFSQKDRETLKGELETLCLMLGRSLTTTLKDLGKVELQIIVIDTLIKIIFSLSSAIKTSKVELVDQKGITNSVIRMVENLLNVLHVSVQSQIALLASQRGETEVQYRDKRDSFTHPIVLSTLFSRLETIVHYCFYHYGKVVNLSSKTFFSTVFENLLQPLLSSVQQYSALQQRKQIEMDTHSSTSHHLSSDENNDITSDPLRVFHVHRAMQRLLSVALRSLELIRLSDETKQSSLRHMTIAASNAFGGVINVNFDGSLLDLDSMDEFDSNPCEGIKKVDAAQEIPLPSNFLRGCKSIVVLSGGAGLERAMEGEMDIDESMLKLDPLGAGQKREATIDSSMGTVTLSALVDAVLLSISKLDVMITVETLQEMHKEGLQTMQYNAARKAQREEIERIRKIEQQGIDDIPAEMLLDTLKTSTVMRSNASSTLRNDAARAMLQLAAFSAVLASYRFVQNESEGRIREAQVLISRCMIQLPPSVLDVAIDELCLCLQTELHADSSHENKATGSAQRVTLLGKKLDSYYNLVIQVLFTFFAAQAPTEERHAASFLLTGITALSEDDPSSRLETKATFGVNTENPVAWLQRDGGGGGLHENTAEPLGQKRSREEGLTNFHREDRKRGSFWGDDDEDAADANDDEMGYFSFHNDKATRPCAYSHFLCRVLELLESASQHSLTLDILLQAPALTRYVWNFIYENFCLSDQKPRCVLGIWLLSELAKRRSVCRSFPINLLLHLSTALNAYPRRLAINQLGKLLSAVGIDGQPVISEEEESQLIRYAIRQLTLIPTWNNTSKNNNLSIEEDAGDEEAVAAAAALKERQIKQMEEVLKRHLGLFLMLCVRSPGELIVSLFNVYNGFVARDNLIMMQLIPENPDIKHMIQSLFESDPDQFMQSVMPSLRRFSENSTLLVQSILWSINHQFRAVCKATTLSSEKSVQRLRQVALTLVNHAKVMYESSSIPVTQDSGGGNVIRSTLHDIRFIAPFLSLLPADDIRKNYLRSFLLFVQAQIRQERLNETRDTSGSMIRRDATSQLGGVGRSFVCTPSELNAFVKDVIREVLVKSSVPFADGLQRGLSRVDFLVFLHRAPHEVGGPSQSKDDNSVSLGGGILNQERRKKDLYSSPASGHNAETSMKISALTTKEVIRVCLELTRTFDSKTVERLYGPEEIQNALKKMIAQPPIPSQIMFTALATSEIYAPSSRLNRSGSSDQFIQFIISEVLQPLSRMTIWEKDAVIWRGVLQFCELYYRDCSDFLCSLPDHVLTQALKTFPVLRESFKEEHGNNASLAPIFGSL